MNDIERLIENLVPEEKEAFLKGYNDCKSGMNYKSSSSITQPTLRPPVGFERTYNDGWRKASEEVIDEAEKKAHHGYALGFIILGGSLMGLSLIMVAVQSVSGTAELHYGLLGTGLVFAITGVVKYFSKGPID